MVRFTLCTLAALAGLATAVPTAHRRADPDAWKKNIWNVVVLVEENRSFDTFAGGLTYDSSIDGLVHTKFCNSLDVLDPSVKTQVCAQERANDVAPDDPNHSIGGVNMQIFDTFQPDEADVNSDPAKKNEVMGGFVTEHSITYKTQDVTRLGEVMNFYTQDQVRVFATMAENFVLFDRWFCSVPGPTNPNRAYITSGTSNGHGRNDAAYNHYGIPSKSVFEALEDANIPWINYANSTNQFPPINDPDFTTQGFNPDAAFYEWTKSSGTYITKIKPLTQFYLDAAAGKLPNFTYINPECCSYQSFHPASSITDGEIFIKSIYEAVRNSPQWDHTLFILTFDEHGGFADHVSPPVGVPPGDSLTWTEKAQNGLPITFGFNRTGIRVPTIVMSPWVPKGHIEKRGHNNGHDYDHTSILGFLSELWGIPKLTPRVEWASTFEHLILDEPRPDSDSPTKLPQPIPFK